MYTGSFQFAQLEQSPHVRTAGRAFYHGSWGRLESPKDTSAGDSDPCSTSSSSEGSKGSAGRGPEVGSGSSEEDGEEQMEEGGFGLDGSLGKDGEEEVVTVAGTKKKESKRRIAWGWPKMKKKNKEEGGKIYGGGDCVDDPDAANGAAGGFGDSGDNDGDGAGEQTELKERDDKDRVKKKKEEEKKRRKKKKEKEKRLREGEQSKPHGEGYVEFLDGWGVSQVSTCWA